MNHKCTSWFNMSFMQTNSMFMILHPRKTISFGHQSCKVSHNLSQNCIVLARRIHTLIQKTQDRPSKTTPHHFIRWSSYISIWFVISLTMPWAFPWCIRSTRWASARAMPPGVGNCDGRQQCGGEKGPKPVTFTIIHKSKQIYGKWLKKQVWWSWPWNSTHALVKWLLCQCRVCVW